jgi:bacterial/archaeal transporter family protein
MWWLYALLSALFASLTAIFAKQGVENINSNLATAIRTAIILIMLSMIVLVRGETKGIGNLSKHSLFFLTISAIATGLSWLFYFKAIQLGNLSQVAPVDKLSVALTIILSVIFLGEHLSLKTALGALFIIAGTIVIVWK